MSLSYTKCLDNATGKFYYINNETQETSWDKPHNNNYLKDTPFACNVYVHHQPINVEKQKLYAEFKKYQTQEKLIEEEDKTKISQNQKYMIWQKALYDAVDQNGTLNISWTKLNDIHPILYTFEITFGMHLLILRLIGISLIHISSELFQSFPCLEVISFATNQLITLPDNIVDNSSQLYELDLTKNNIQSLPSRFGLLSSLSHLHLSNNQLERLPITFGALRLLVKLELESNQLIALPETLDHLICCEHINVNNNLLTKLPRCIGRMTSLLILSATHNKIAYLPDDICHNRSIIILRININKLKYMPEKFGDMKQLKELCLSNNQLTKLPATFYKLLQLETLRVDNNPDLLDPTPEILMGGAQSVVANCFKSFQDTQWRIMKAIVGATQEVLQQAEERGIADPAHFRANVLINGETDGWFAVNMAYFWSTLLPSLKQLWRAEIAASLNNSNSSSNNSNNGIRISTADNNNSSGTGRKKINNATTNTTNKNNNTINNNNNNHSRIHSDASLDSFPYSESEVNWALDSFTDAYGYLKRAEAVMFTRCACTHKITGQRMPCVPPQVGFMCRKIATCIKSNIVRQVDKKERIWKAYKKKSIDDAITRAKHEAIAYLESKPGRKFVEEKAFEKAEEMLADQGADGLVGWKIKIAENRKNKVIQRYSTLINDVDRELHKKTAEIDEEIELLQEQEVNSQGYAQISLNTKITKLAMMRATMEEHFIIQSLQKKCEHECLQIDDDVFGKGDDESSDDSVHSSDDSLSEPSCDSDDSDDPNAAMRWVTYRRHLLKKAALLRQPDYFNNLHPNSNNHNNNSSCNNNKKRKGVLSSQRESTPMDIATEYLQKAYHVASQYKLKQISHMNRQKRKIHRQWRHVLDVSEYRVRKLYLESTGQFQELKNEMMAEIGRQYELNQGMIAKQKAERDLVCVETFRHHWGGVSLETVFYEWKRYFQSRHQRERVDLYEQWVAAKQQFESAMQSIFLAQHSVDKWEKCQDVYTDAYYWRHVDTGQVTLDEPGIHNYLPADFEVPAAPSTGIEDGDDDDEKSVTVTTTHLGQSSDKMKDKVKDKMKDKVNDSQNSHSVVLQSSSTHLTKSLHSQDAAAVIDSSITSIKEADSNHHNPSSSSSSSSFTVSTLSASYNHNNNDSNNNSIIINNDNINSNNNNSNSNSVIEWNPLDSSYTINGAAHLNHYHHHHNSIAHAKPVIPPATASSSSSSLKFSYGPDSLRPGVWTNPRIAVFQEDSKNVLRKHTELPKIYADLNIKVAAAKLEAMNSMMNSSNGNDSKSNTPNFRLPSMEKCSTDINKMGEETRLKAEQAASRARVELRKRREESQQIRDETYRRQREMVPHSYEDTVRYKELQRLQNMKRKEQEITEKEFFDYHYKQKGFWQREIKPLFTKMIPNMSITSDDEKGNHHHHHHHHNNGSDDDDGVSSDNSSNSSKGGKNGKKKSNKKHSHHHHHHQSHLAVRRSHIDLKTSQTLVKVAAVTAANSTTTRRV